MILCLTYPNNVLILQHGKKENTKSRIRKRRSP